MSTNPKILNLDELELEESDITIRHEGKEHRMKVLGVDDFIRQQKRQSDTDKLMADADPADEVTMGTVVETIRDSIKEFFPTIDVGSLPTPKLFAIFAWMNDLSAKLNEASAEDVVAEVQEEVGNEEKPAAE